MKLAVPWQEYWRQEEQPQRCPPTCADLCAEQGHHGSACKNGEGT